MTRYLGLSPSQGSKLVGVLVFTEEITSNRNGFSPMSVSYIFLKDCPELFMREIDSFFGACLLMFAEIATLIGYHGYQVSYHKCKEKVPVDHHIKKKPHFRVKVFVCSLKNN